MLTLREAALQLGITESGLRKVLRRRGIRYFQDRPHSAIRFRQEWIDEYIEGHTVDPTTDRPTLHLITAPQRSKRNIGWKSDNKSFGLDWSLP